MPIPSVDELIRHQNVLLEAIEKKVDVIGEGHIGLDPEDRQDERKIR
jgi:hypothetical protein